MLPKDRALVKEPHKRFYLAMDFHKVKDYRIHDPNMYHMDMDMGSMGMGGMAEQSTTHHHRVEMNIETTTLSHHSSGMTNQNEHVATNQTNTNSSQSNMTVLSNHNHHKLSSNFTNENHTMTSSSHHGHHSMTLNDTNDHSDHHSTNQTHMEHNHTNSTDKQHDHNCTHAEDHGTNHHKHGAHMNDVIAQTQMDHMGMDHSAHAGMDATAHAGHDHSYIPQIDHISGVLPPSPLLTQYKDIPQVISLEIINQNATFKHIP